MRIVLKFGGTSLSDPQRIRTAARRIAELMKKGVEVVAVVSARGHTTDGLLEDVTELCPAGADKRELDACLATGEQLSAALMAMTLLSMGIPAVRLTGWQAGVLTDETRGNARILRLQSDRIQKELASGKAVIVAGFQGISAAGEITTLGRGGSDTTAVALAALLEAQLCRIYTDVDGVYDKDPRVFADAVKYSRIGYDEMLTLARQGAQVLHDRCVEWGKEYDVIIHVLSSFRPGPGTFVTDLPDALLTDIIKDIP